MVYEIQTSTFTYHNLAIKLCSRKRLYMMARIRYIKCEVVENCIKHVLEHIIKTH